MARTAEDPITWRLRLVERLNSGHARRVREAANVTQVELAARLQASEASVIRWERGDHPPRDVRVVVRWLAFLAEAEAALHHAGIGPEVLDDDRASRSA